MIIKQDFETLNNDKGIIDIDALEKRSKDIYQNWENYIVDNSNGVNFKINNEMKLVYKPVGGKERISDISEFAFTQLCSRVGVPASYIKKCFESGKTELALQNFISWSGNTDKCFMVRELDGVVRAVLSDNYKAFDSYKVIRTLKYTVNKNIYQPNQAFLSEDRFHIRYINFTPLDVPDSSKLYAGFTVSSSDVGRGSLNIKYHLYRAVCRNGMAISKAGGTLYKQSHIGSNMDGGKIEEFQRAFQDVGILNDRAVDAIIKSSEKKLGAWELKMFLERARRELHLSKKSQERMDELISIYGKTEYGVLNSITELAQDFSLDTRIEMETFAGNVLIR